MKDSDLRKSRDRASTSRNENVTTSTPFLRELTMNNYGSISQCSIADSIRSNESQSTRRSSVLINAQALPGLEGTGMLDADCLEMFSLFPIEFLEFLTKFVLYAS